VKIVSKVRDEGIVPDAELEEEELELAEITLLLDVEDDKLDAELEELV